MIKVGVTGQFHFLVVSARLYKRVCLSVGPSVGNAFVSAGRDEPANNLFCVYKLVPKMVQGLES